MRKGATSCSSFGEGSGRGYDKGTKLCASFVTVGGGLGFGLSGWRNDLLTSPRAGCCPRCFTVTSYVSRCCFMFGEYKVGRCSRQCHALKRPLGDGEWYYSVVLESDDEYERRDYSAESWKGPPEGAIGWWKNRMPTSDDKKMVLAPPEVLIDLLRKMADFPGKEKSRYLLALMLMRRRIVRPAKSGGLDPPGGEPEKVMRVEVIADGSVIETPICVINRGESDALRDELNELLYCEADQE